MLSYYPNKILHLAESKLDKCVINEKSQWMREIILPLLVWVKISALDYQQPVNVKFFLQLLLVKASIDTFNVISCHGPRWMSTFK